MNKQVTKLGLKIKISTSYFVRFNLNLKTKTQFIFELVQLIVNIWIDKKKIVYVVICYFT